MKMYFLLFWDGKVVGLCGVDFYAFFLGVFYEFS